jgi:starvation-inducible DNA-binding protein
MAIDTSINTQSVVSSLNKQLANWSVLYVKLHNYHWFVKGEQFFRLHEKFEEFYNEAASAVDEIAERILAIGGKPLATMKEYLSNASIQESSGGESANQMVQTIAADFGAIVQDLKEGIRLAEEAVDHPTADILTGMRTSLEKHMWMLNALLGK